jgi:hypothetical protein
MSCGNRFQCALRNPSRFSFKPDKPSNPELFNENQKKLNDLLKAREEMDKSFTSPLTSSSSPSPNNLSLIQIDKPIENTVIQNNTIQPTQYTPWKVPSTSNYTPQNKNIKLD